MSKLKFRIEAWKLLRYAEGIYAYIAFRDLVKNTVEFACFPDLAAGR